MLLIMDGHAPLLDCPAFLSATEPRWTRPVRPANGWELSRTGPHHAQ
jgi:hypothetical protein